MAAKTNIFTTIRTEGALLPADLLQRISEGANVDGLTPDSYHRPGEKLNEAINRSWNALQGAWASFRTAQEKLPEGDLGTTITRERWLLPLFRELDYGRLQTTPAIEVDGNSYAISHGWEHVPVHLVSYKLDLDKRTPGVAGASTASPHSLIQVALNRSDNHLWGFLSNGTRLRILRDNVTLTRQAYVEFDLEAMMDGEVYSDFVLLWLLCHQSRVEGERPSDCWLEKWMKTAEQLGTRALEQLRVGVEAAITAFGSGFLAHPVNAVLREKLQSGELDKQDYYRQLLRLVYRMLFLFVAEDRQIDGRSVLLNPNAPQDAADRYMKYYSTQRLRGMAESFKGTRHPDLFEGLRLVMRLLSGEENGKGEGLAVVPLGSFLFSDGAVADVIGCKIANQHLLDAVRALSLTYDDRAKVYRSVDYRNLGPEELGSVYESLLELHPQINVPARTFALATAGGNERKTTGSYYTPSSLINALLDSALDPVLNEAAKKGEAAILDLKICDPACGSGHFLIAAAHRIAKALASIRTGEEEPSPAAIQEAKRDVIGRCIYGVDINPMAVELCKVNLWMEALEPGKPLSFLESHIRTGNSLLGTTPKLMLGGIPDDAFNPIEGDDKKIAAALKKANREARKQREAKVMQLGLFDQPAPPADYAALNRAAAELNTMDDDTLDDLRRKEAAYAALATGSEAHKARLLADAWCAAFVWEKGASNDLTPLTDLTYRRLENALRDGTALTDDLIAVINEVARLRDRYQFFHWHVTFPDVFPVPDDAQGAGNEQTGWDGGFSCVLGNPPWDRLKPEPSKFFASLLPEITDASTSAEREKLLNSLAQDDPDLFQNWKGHERTVLAAVSFLTASNAYRLTALGKFNLGNVFLELSRNLLSPAGRSGLLNVSGIATDDSGKEFIADVMTTGTLVSFYDFENRNGLFPGVHRSYKFSAITLTSPHKPVKAADFVFFALDITDLEDDDKHITYSALDIALLNPISLNCPVFRSKRQAEIVKQIYRRSNLWTPDHKVLFRWDVEPTFLFVMSDHSGLFETKKTLDIRENLRFPDIIVRSGGQPFLPLYESKMFHQFEHRWSNADTDNEEEIDVKQRTDSCVVASPRYWMSASNAITKLNKLPNNWLIAIRGITNATNERTSIVAIIPKYPVGHSAQVFRFNMEPLFAAPFVANFNTLSFDFAARTKVGGSNLSSFILRQLPVLPSEIYTSTLLDFIIPRVLELTYTAWDLQPFAQDVGWQSAPFVWDEERRFLMRCELDALYFHLYQIPRDDVDYIMDTFPIVKRKDEAAHGEYRTKRVILEMYDQMAALPKMAVPAPKDETATYLVPDVGQWQTWLSPPPADPSVAHEDKR